MFNDLTIKMRRSKKIWVHATDFFFLFILFFFVISLMSFYCQETRLAKFYFLRSMHEILEVKARMLLRNQKYQPER